MKHIWRLLIVALMVCAAEVPLFASDSGGTGTATLNSGTSAAFSVWISPAMVRVGKTDTPGTTSSINLFGARGETLDTQIIVSAGSSGLSNVDLSASALIGPGGVTIAASNVVLYREYYVTTSGTIRSGGSNPPMGAGTYADPLIPFVDPQTGAPLNGSLKAVPATVAAGQNQPFWVDISVPHGASNVPPGIYNGTITVTTSQGSVGVPVSITVWNFELPVTPSAFSEIDYGASSGETTRGFNQLLMRHKLMPRNDSASSAAADMATLGLNRSGLDGYYYIGIQCNGSYTNLPSQSQIASAAANFPAGLPLDFRPADEVDGCTGAYGPLKTLATNAHPNGVKLNLTTTSPDPNLYGAIDRWIVIAAGEQWPTLPFTHGELWSYASCWVGNGNTPEWMIDYPPIDPRMQSGFLNWTQGATGVLYWAVNYWNAGNTIASWDNVDTTWCGSAAGDGIFIYPPGPIGSSESAPGIRFKAIRDGIQDYEYAQLLKNAGQSSFVSSTLQSIAASWTNWTKDPNALAAARLQLGQKLDQLSVPAIAVTPSFQDFGTVIVGSSANRDFTVQNTGGGTLSGTASTSLPYSIFSGGSYDLGAGQSQTVTVRFSPSSGGAFLGSVSFIGGGGATRNVSGAGNSPTARTLTVASSSPSSGVAVTVTPADNNGVSNGMTQFTRVYNNATQVTLTASSTFGGNAFSSWTGCDTASGVTCNLSMTTDRTVTVAYISLGVNPTSAAPGATLTITWSGIPNPTSTDWVGLYAVGAGNGSYLAWMYVSCSQTATVAKAAGSCGLAIPANLANGSYQLRFLVNDGFSAVAISSAFTVGGPPLPVVSIVASGNAAEPATNGQFTVSRTGSTANALTVNFTVSGTATQGTDYANIGTSVVILAGSGTAAIPVTVIDDLAFEGAETVVITLSNNANYVVGDPNSAMVTIADNEAPPAGPTIGANPTMVNRGGSVTATWSGIVNPTAKDWIGLYAVGAGNGSYLAWVYVSCSQTPGATKPSGTCGLFVPSNLVNGPYEVRLLANDGFNSLATSNLLTLQ